MPILTQADIAKCRKAFKQFDRDNDGHIQICELRHGLKEFCSEEQIDAIIAAADADRNGEVDFAEFLRIAQEPTLLGRADGQEPTLDRNLTNLLPDDPAFIPEEPPPGPRTAMQEVQAMGGTGPKCCFIIPMIHPDSTFSQSWQMLTAFAIIYAALMTPVLLAFQDQLTGEGKDQVLAVDMGVNSIFIADILVNFISMYIDSSGELVSSKKAIACRYIRSWFFPDMVSSIPLDFIIGSGDNEGEQGLLYAKLARMGKLARVFRLLRILKMLKLLRLIKFITHFDRMFQRVLSNDKYDSEGSKAYQFMKFCVFALVVSHVAGCLWYALAKFHDNVEDTWIESRDIRDAKIIDQYLASMYFIITTLTTVGYGDISASTNAEIIVAIFLMMGGVLGYSISVGTVSTVLMQEDQRNTIISSKMQTLAHFAKDTNMDIAEYNKIRRHIKRKYGESLDWMAHLEGPAQLQSLLADLPVVLRAKMLRHMHNGKHLNLEFFSRYKDDDLFAYIVPLLFSAHFDTLDMVFIKGDYAERIYFLTKGTVVYFSLEDFERNEGSNRQLMSKDAHEKMEMAMEDAEPFQVVVDGATFGEFEVLLGIPRQECVRCDIASHCLALHKKDILRILAEFPPVAEFMRQEAKKEFRATMKRKMAWAESKGIKIYDTRHIFKQSDEEIRAHVAGSSGSFTPKDGSPIENGKGSKKNLKDKEKPGREVIPVETSLPLPPPRGGTQPAPKHSMVSSNGSIEARLEEIQNEMSRKLNEACEQQNSSINEVKEQQEFLKDQVQEVRTMLLGIDLRIQSLVLRT